jgi:Zn-dependent M28 family amino/carboxypeptidase
MKSRRTFLKIAAGLAAFVIPWTVLPGAWAQKLGSLMGIPSSSIEFASGEGTVWVPSTQAISRKAIEDVQYLSHANLEGRRAGTAGETKVLVYLEGQFKALLLKSFSADNYWQLFSIPSMKEKMIDGRALFRPDETDTLRVPAANILAGITGNNPEQTLILSAHFDHLGIYNGEVYPGANDNASGVGCILQVIRQLVKEAQDGFAPKINIAVAFWSAEEMGFLGSKYFVQNPLIPLSEIKAVINADTVGNGAVGEYILWSAGGNSQTLIETMKDAGRVNGAVLEHVSGGSHHSDEISFTGTGIPAVTILGKEWLVNNHTPGDKISAVNEEKLEMTCNIIYRAIKSLAY